MMLHLGRRRLLAGGTVTAVLAVAALLAAAGPAAAQGGTLYVNAATGNDGNPCTSAAPCLTIGHAVAVAAPGSTIMVASGTYTEDVQVTHRLTLVGAGAVIDATGLDNGIVISGPGAAGTTVEGFTVENANAEGILAVATSRLGILDNELLHNDQTPGNTSLPQCNPPAPLPPDCGEGLHLNGVSSSQLSGNNIHDNVGGILITDEAGPSHGNTIIDNVALNNKVDCGITMASHNPLAASDSTKGGIYDNTVVGNLSEGNGGAGVGMFAAPPGGGSYDNFVYDNQLLNNGEEGIGIHAHSPGQRMSGNVIVGNTVSGNGVDPDAGSGQPAGISLLNADPFHAIQVLIVGNSISNESWGLFVNGSFSLFATNVTPVGYHS